MYKYKKRVISFLLCLGMIACFNSFNQPVYASNYTTNGVVEFTKTTETTGTTDTTDTTDTNENGQKPSESKESEADGTSSSKKPVGKLPSTGEIISKLSTLGIGLLIVLFCLFLLGQTRRKKHEK